MAGVFIARRGTPAARLVAVEVVSARVELGTLADQVEIFDDFDDPLTDLAPYTA